MAAYTVSTLIPYGTTQANMINLANFIFGSVLTGAGWVQTGDTGQQSSASWPAISGTNTANGYQVWRMADALQGSYPVYMKVELGSGSVAGVIAFWITIGTGSSGAGAITGTLLARTQFGNYSNLSTTAFPSFGSGSTSRFNWALWLNLATSNSAFYFGVERSKDGTGADTNVGLIINSMGGTTSPQQFWTQYIPFSGTVVAAKQAFISGLDSYYIGGTLSDGLGNISMIGIAPWSLQGPRNYGLQLLGYYGPDMAAMQPITVSVRGGNHTYYTMGAQMNWATPFVSGVTSSCPAFLYE